MYIRFLHDMAICICHHYATSMTSVRPSVRLSVTMINGLASFITRTRPISCSMLSPVSAGMDDRLREGIYEAQLT